MTPQKTVTPPDIEGTVKANCVELNLQCAECGRHAMMDYGTAAGL